MTFIVIVLYFLPALIAVGKKKKNAGAILAMNILLGWTGFGWVVALIWAITND